MSWSSSPTNVNRQENYKPGRSSPLRHNSNASSASSYSMYSNPFPPSRTSTISSAASSGYSYSGLGHKRGLSETSPTRPAHPKEPARLGDDSATNFKSLRQSLRPLPHGPNTKPLPVATKTLSPLSSENSLTVSDIDHDTIRLQRPQRGSEDITSHVSWDNRSLEQSSTSVSEGRVMSSQDSTQGSHRHHLSTPDLTELTKSTTPYLKNLSHLAQTSDSDDFSTAPSTPSVVGLSGRRQLKRTGSVRPTKTSNSNSTPSIGSAWAENNWMERQRQFIQAYEYLCHIGEAREWIQDVIHKELPAIIQLEEALRNGITLAELVQAFYPERRIRIFRDAKLQFRHFDNIDLFFRFLTDMELPELFRFETIDLYEKKNIPKVIYCIHALSWLLYRKGLVDFKIGNLIGQLEFAHHELEETQRGLDRAGVSMPSFAGMGATFGAEPEPPPPEPKESESERIDRELHELEFAIIDLQAQARGAVVRMQLGETMQSFWDSETSLVSFQSVVRGKWSREIAAYRAAMRASAIVVQSAARGFVVRNRNRKGQAWCKDSEPQILMLQSAFRAKKTRDQHRRIRCVAQQSEASIRHFQSAIRGALQRKVVNDQYEETQLASSSLDKLQAVIRSRALQRSLRVQEATLRAHNNQISRLQASSRGVAQRKQVDHILRRLEADTATVIKLQSCVRGGQRRRAHAGFMRALAGQQHSISVIQATVRGRSQRQAVAALTSELHHAEVPITDVQCLCRGFQLRRSLEATLQSLSAEEAGIQSLQSSARGFIARKRCQIIRKDLLINASDIVLLQSVARAVLLRHEIGQTLGQLEEEEAIIEALQAAIRGKIVREKFAEKQRFFKSNMEKVVKVQSFVRAKLQGEAYKSLTSGANPPVGTVKNFVHLLNDSNFDFDEEIEFERARKTVVQHVRQNEMAGQYIQQLDIKIALLVKNKITLDEVVKHQKHFGGAAGTLLTNKDFSSKDPFDLKALNKNSRRKLEHYQELFFILQTQPQYLARMFKHLREQGTAEKEHERLKHLMMGLFGYAQKRREEYYLIKLIVRSLREEIESASSLQEYLRSNFFWTRLFSAYTKSPRDRKFMRELLGPIVKETIIENPDLNLESDPMQIYLTALENEELRTGRPSQRSPDIPREAAIRDPETKRTFITHLQDLRDIADQFFLSLEDQLHRLPFGVRYIAQQMYNALTARFHHDDRGHILQIVGNWVWKSYLQPAFAEPEKYGVVDRGLSQEHKRNIGEVSKVVNQVASSRLFGGENVFLQPLNSYVGESIQRLGDTWSNLLDVPDAETQFDIDEFNDLYARTKPTLYIKLTDIFAVHHLVAAEAPYACPNREDMLQEVIHELGSAKANESELKGMSTSEICLTLNPKLHEAEDPDAEFKALFTECKRCILYIIRVQSGGDLMDIMVKPITPEDEDRWDALVEDELGHGSRRTGAYADAQTTVDIAAMSYPELKRTALENILRLEQMGRLTRHNHYQDLLNAIALDIRTKHRRRVQRQRELETVRLTLARLNDQAVYLEGQLKTYNDYIEQAMMTLQNKKGKKRFLLPFTKQWDHERELARSGRVPKFGSFKYSAQDLANRGILLTWAGYPERQYQHLDLTISSNEVGVFTLEGSNGAISIPGASAQLPLDDLLQAQFNNTQVMEFFDEDGRGGLRVNVNLFVHLIMRKFYKDKD